MAAKRQKFDVRLLTKDNFSYLRLDIFGDEEINVNDVNLIAQMCKEKGGGEVLPLLIIVDEYTLPSAEARKFIAQKDSNPYAKAEAYVIKDLSQKIVGNFFLKVDKPARPTKIFSNEQDALEWLKKFI